MNDKNADKPNLSKDSNPKKKDVEAAGKTGSVDNSKRPILMFGLTIAVLMGLFYAYLIFDPFPGMSLNRLFPSYQHLNASISGAILGMLGHDIKVVGETISSSEFSVNIKHGCDAIEPTALLVFAVLAFPVPFLKKLPGVFVGVVFLAIVNIIRIVSLFLIGVYYPKAFHTMHVDVWQAMFIFCAIVFWILWALWAGKSKVKTQS